MRKNQTFLIIAFFVLIAVGACKKESISKVAIPERVAHFTNETSGSFFIQNTPNATFKIPIGITAPATTDTKITVSVSSPTGAVAGTQYNLPSATITIPAGETVDSLSVQGLFAGYPGNRKDTLVFTLTGGDVSPASYNNTYTLVLQKYCNVDLSAFTGIYIAQDYDATTNLPDGAAYSLALTPGTSGATSGNIVVSGLWGIPDPFTVNVDWTNPASFSTNIADQPWFIHPTYGQARIKAAGVGTFSSCENTVVIRYEVYVSAGTFGRFYTTLRK
jgi:hypothetical protein